MKFIARMAFREIRASWHRLLFFFICIAIGVGAIITLRSLVQNLSARVNREARSLLTADVQVTSNTKWDKDTRSILDRYNHLPIIESRTETVDLATMARPEGKTSGVPKMVELKAVNPGYPFYGDLVLGEGQKYDFSLLQGNGALVKPALLASLEARIGDKIRIGKSEFIIRGTVEQEPGNSLTAFSFGPRVIVSYDDATRAGLLGFGSRARYRMLYKVRPNTDDQLVRVLRSEFKSKPLINIRSFRYSQDRMGESLNQVEDYLSLVGLIILVLGGIGISSVTRVFVDQKMKTIAILKCLGGRNSRVIGTYMAQVLFLGVAGSILGLGLAWLTLLFVPRYFAGRLPFGLEFNLTLPAVMQGLGLGLMIAILFSLLPLLDIRNIKPVLVLRHDTDRKKRRFDWVRIAAAIVVLAGLVALASWQAGSLRIGIIFLSGLAVATLVLNVAAVFLMQVLRGLRHLPSFVLRQGVTSLYRPGNQTRTILLAVGLGVFFILSIRMLQANLLGEFSLDMDSTRADLYIIDIQKDQKDGVVKMVKQATGSDPVMIPTVRARILKVKDDPVALETPVADAGATPDPSQSQDRNESAESRERRAATGLLRREYVLTYRPTLDPSEKIIAGKFWDSTPSPQPEASIEEVISRDLKVGIGDTITFDVLGASIEAKVTSVRKVDWRNARTAFLIVFRPGTLESAPQMLLSAINGPSDQASRAKFQRDLVDKYPNLSVIDVYDIIEVARSIVSNVSLAVTFVGSFVVLSGLLILIGSIAMTKYHRLYESAILKTLGAKRKLIVTSNIVEYGVLGAIAGLIGAAAAVALSWAVSYYGLKITWQFQPAITLGGVLITLVLVIVVGVLSSWDVIIRKPLGILRAE